MSKHYNLTKSKPRYKKFFQFRLSCIIITFFQLKKLSLIFAILIFFFIFHDIIKGQHLYEDTTIVFRNDEYHSHFGYRINPIGQYRALNIFVNVIYDETPDEDPITTPNEIWPAPSDPTKNTINIDKPIYLPDFMDAVYIPPSNGGAHGSLTRVFSESSFDLFVLLGDFMVVNIKQSTIPKDNNLPGSFTKESLANAVVNLINQNDGLDAIYGHNDISDYDNLGSTETGVYKPTEPNDKIDIIQIITRNTTEDYGGAKNGQGYGYFRPSEKLIINGQEYGYDLGTYQCVGDRNLAKWAKNIITHELSHNLFGPNNFHTSGGNHYSGGGTNTWFGIEGGYGLMGGGNSGLVSCNGYERWRMNWTSPVYNPQGHPIQANGVPSDISKEDGPKSFTLRDFVTTGDAIRIKLPYIDEDASNQYIWLENHQIGKNDKLDYLRFSIYANGEIWHECRPLGTPGIYSYIQVGKDTLDGTKLSDVFPWNETDNLRIISAEGNWDFIKMEDEEHGCVRGGLQYTAKRYLPNSLSGYQDQTTHFYSDSTKLSGDDGNWLDIKYDSDGSTLVSNYLPHIGDTLDAFTGSSRMSIGTNPSPANVTTYYVTQSKGNFQDSDANTNTSHIYLSGLRIDMEENPDGTFDVDIVWDDYDVKEDVRWAGNIVMKEKVVLKNGKTIEIDQSLTPNQIDRDPVSDLFAKPTVFTCEDGSEFIMESGSNVTLKNKSTLLLESGSVFEIYDNATLTVNSGDTLKIEPGAELNIHEGGQIIIQNGGMFIINGGSIAGSGIITVAGKVEINCDFSTEVEFIINGGQFVINDGGIFLQNNNSTMSLSEEGVIWVRPGGKLIVDNGAITGYLGDEWNGIRVFGRPKQPQTFENQGVVILKNGALIENADVAVKLGSDSGLNGGIIQATDAVFRNNRKDVVFYPYENIHKGEGGEFEVILDNISYFENCSLKTNYNTPFGFSRHPHVKMDGVRGIEFKSCYFVDDRDIDGRPGPPEPEPFPPGREGIRAHSTSFKVRDCTFENLTPYGIYATASKPNRSFTVTNSNFSSFRGIYFNGMDNVRIRDNNFDVLPGYEYDCNPIYCEDTYGVYIDYAQNLEIENNYFISEFNGFFPEGGSFGIIANNTGEIYKEIYRNDFNGFKIGIEAIGLNRGRLLYDGLELRCHRFNNNEYDIFVTDEGIRAMQGHPPPPDVPCNETLAGNLFGNDSPILVSNYLNESYYIYYHHHNIASEPNVVPSFLSEETIFLEHYVNEPYDYETSCPPRYEIEPMSKLFAGMESSWIQYEETADKLAKLVDDGNTELMVQLVEMTTTQNAYQNYQYLMATSPYLSEKVLTTLSAKEEGFSKAMIRDVLVENPQAAKSKEVNNALDNRKDPLPEYMREQINKGLHYFGEMELLRFEKAYHKTQHDKALNRIISSIVHEDKGWENAPGITTILSDVDDMNYQYLLAEFEFSDGDYTQGFEVLSSIEKHYELDEEALAVHKDYLSFYAFLKKWDNEKHPAFTNLPEEALIELETFIGSGNRISGKALSLLMINDAIDYEEPIIYPAKQTGPKTEPHTPQPSDFVAGKDYPFHFNLFPNPCKNYITLSWCTDTEMRGLGIIEIRNSQGVLMHSMKVTGYCDQQIISLYDWKSGSYVAVFRWGSIRKTLPFIIVR